MEVPFPYSSACGPLQCVGQRVGAVGALSGAATRVGQCISSTRTGHLGHWRDTCRLIAQVDEDIRAGLLPRELVATCASPRLLGSSFGFFHGKIGLLLALLNQEHVPGKCACVVTVLNWGTCPHVLFFVDDEAYTPMWWCRSYRVPAMSSQFLSLFLAYGCLPAVSVKPGHWTRQVTPVRTMYRQWFMWHCRLGRRLWCIPVP